MKSNVGKPSNLNNYDFDFGINTASSNNRIRSLNGSVNESKPKPASSSSSSSTTTSWNPNKPSWTHQPLPNQAALQQPSSMVGDIFGKSWGSAASGGGGSRIGIPEKDPNLFGDLLGSALGQGGGKSNSNVPLKNAAPISNKNNAASAAAAYSMGNVADSLPKTSSSVKNNTSNWGGSGEKLGSYSSVNNNSNKTGNLGMRGGGAPAAASTTTKDPFVSLVGFGSKKEPTLNKAAAASKNVNSTNGDYSFGEFQNAAKSSTSSTNNNSMGSHPASAGSKTESFGAFDIPIQDFNSQKQASSQSQSKSDDPLGMLFSSSSASPAPTPGGSQAHESQTFSGVDDWGLGSHFGGDDNATTTELEGLPPPPTGMTASAAKSKGMDNQKQGQHADAIKWLSWAVVLLEKSGDTATNLDVLSCRASCFKEVGEYKKAVADCSKVLEHEPENVPVLVQRALLYESTEKYRLGAEDLRAVLKIDPGNRLARSTIHRLTQLAD